MNEAFDLRSASRSDDRIFESLAQAIGVQTLCCWYSQQAAQHAPQGVEYSGGPRRVVAGHPWTATSLNEVALSEASPPEAAFERCSLATSSPWRWGSPADVCAVVSTKIFRIQAAIASLGPDNAEEKASLEISVTRAESPCGVGSIEGTDTDAPCVLRATDVSHGGRARSDFQPCLVLAEFRWLEAPC